MNRAPIVPRRIISQILFLLAMGVTAEPLHAAAQDPAVAFVDVNVVPMDRERVLQRQSVIVRNGRIVEMGPAGSTPIPDGAMRIDGRGKYLMPGLAEMHGHLPNPSQNYPERWPYDVLFLYVANGVTTVRGMQGAPRHLELRTKIESGEVLGPRLYVASPSLSARQDRGVLTAEEGERLVRQYKNAGFDLLKIHEGLSQQVYNAIAATAREVNIPFGGHVPDAVGLYIAIEAGQITVDHLDNTLEAMDHEESKIPEVVRAMREAGTWVVPTEVLWETAFLVPPTAEQLRAERTEVMYVPQRLLQFWAGSVDRRRQNSDTETGRKSIALRRKLIKALLDGGVGILLGTDSPQIFSVPGFSIHREMRVMVESGMTPYQVLESGTRRVAEYFGTLETAGTVAKGKRADLILVNANPLEDVANVAKRTGVMVNGRWLSEGQIQETLQEIAAAYRR